MTNPQKSPGNWIYRLREKLKCRPYLEHAKGGVWCISVEARRMAQNSIQNGLIIFLIFILVLWLGAEAQSARTGAEVDTVYLYQTTNVCGLKVPASFHDLDTSTTTSTSTDTTADSDNHSTLLDPIVMETFDSPESARALNNNNTNSSGVVVAHCGNCGACSNPHDIGIYDQTKETLFQSSYKCSKRAIVGGRRVTRRCLKEAIGFSDGCNDCWVDNIMCDLKFCVFVCMWHAIFSEVNAETPGQQQALNRCTECDEKRCGPAFVTCAGANRRRSGILSEFERDKDQEVCTAVDQGWWQDERLQEYWALQQQQQQGQHHDDGQDVVVAAVSVKTANSVGTTTTTSREDTKAAAEDPIRRLRLSTVN
jgi:hypothetical protein